MSLNCCGVAPHCRQHTRVRPSLVLLAVSYGARDWDPAPAYLLAATLYANLVNSVSERVQAQWIRNNANACAPG